MAKQTYDDLKPTHDEFFRFLTESPAVRYDMVRVCFPDLATEIDLGALSVVPGEFSGGKRADLLLSAVDSRGKADDTSSEHLLYFLVEHKARPERMVAVQLLSYAAAILEQHRGRRAGGRKHLVHSTSAVGRKELFAVGENAPREAAVLHRVLPCPGYI